MPLVWARVGDRLAGQREATDVPVGQVGAPAGITAPGERDPGSVHLVGDLLGWSIGSGDPGGAGIVEGVEHERDLERVARAEPTVVQCERPSELVHVRRCSVLRAGLGDPDRREPEEPVAERGQQYLACRPREPVGCAGLLGIGAVKHEGVSERIVIDEIDHSAGHEEQREFLGVGADQNIDLPTSAGPDRLQRQAWQHLTVDHRLERH